MPLVENIRGELTAALRSGDTKRRDTLRLVIAGFDNERIRLGHPLADDEALAVLRREAKQRRESIEEFQKGGRADLVAVEQGELEIISSYLPAELTDDELQRAAREVIATMGASGPGDIGKVMGPLMQHLAGRADGRRVNALVRELLAAG